ncbi:aspartate carbamoyltransferase regulatory subunit [Clostridiaceae bacterium 35-E11]
MINLLKQDFVDTHKPHLELSSIKEGIVLDHIPSGEGINIFNHLVLNMLDVPIALFVNLPSLSLQTKDIITIEFPISMNLNFLDTIHSDITINIIKNHEIVNKLQRASWKNMQDCFC